MNRRHFLKAMSFCLLAVQSSTAWASGRRVMLGDINGTMPIEMDITCEANVVRGSYTYRATGNRYELDGVLNGSECVLNERHQGAHSGTFRGVLFGEGSTSFSGIWTSADGTRSYPFSLS